MAVIDRADIALLARDPAPEVKAELCRKVVNALDLLDLGEVERDLARDVLALLAKDVENRVRIAVSRQISASPHLTPDLARRLALDVEDEVALPVIRNAASLAENLLISLLQVPSTLRQVAVAGRPDVTDNVAGAIIEGANLAAIVKLVRNEKAQIGLGNLNKVTANWGRLPPVQSALVDRPDLPDTIVEQLVSIVSHHLRSSLIERYDLEPELVTHLVARGREVASLLILKRGRTSDQDPLLLAMQLQKSGRMSVPLLFLILLSGDFELFCACLSVVCKLPAENVRKLVLDDGKMGLSLLLERAGIPARLTIAFEAVVGEMLDSGYRGADEQRAKFQIKAVTRVYETCSPLGDSQIDGLLASVMAAGTAGNGGLLAVSPRLELSET